MEINDLVDGGKTGESLGVGERSRDNCCLYQLVKNNSIYPIQGCIGISCTDEHSKSCREYTDRGQIKE